ncbi:unnamed protein product [Cuscuta europaea]|uniref:ELM2 domain-containing protein n=1 Tax=Cuscuta europaea TaxID=41803 RepID=A0A9P1EGC7_CUSEU|nr:unnamed protein product [Cuscuta europaea]
MDGQKQRIEQGIVEGCSALEPRGSVFGKYSDADMLFKLKRIALDPCDPKAGFRKSGSLLNQTLRVRKVLSIGDPDCPRRKRKLQLYIKGNLRNAPNLPLETFDNKTKEKKSRRQLSHASTVSCFNSSVKSKSFEKNAVLTSHSPTSLLTFEESLQERMFSESFLNAVDMGPPANYISSVIDSDESVNGSDPLSPVDLKLTPIEAPLLALDELIHNSKSLTRKGSKSRHLQSPRRSIRLENFIDDPSPKMVVPVGPRFQAEIPEWSEPVGYGQADGGYDDSRWLGTKVWPIEMGNTKLSTKYVGKGRAESCTCQAPASVECVRCHVLEERLRLKCDLGPAFSAWKFDEMGEQMLKSWTAEDQKTFEPLVKKNPHSNGKKFLKQALKSFRSELRTTVVNYYFNVFLPRRISMLTRMSLVELVDTDDDAEDSNNLHLRDICDGKSVDPGRSNDVKRTRYLRLRT